MTATGPTASLPIALKALRLPTIARTWPEHAAEAQAQAWDHPRFLASLCQAELAERGARRLAARFQEARLPPGKRLATFDLAQVPSLRRALIDDLCAGDWVKAGGNVLAFGPSGTGKSHLCAAIAAELIERGWRVLCTRTTDLVQHLQAARRDLTLPALLAKLDRMDVLILDDLGYARKDQAETGVLFELIAERYERRSLMITCNQPFSEWDQIFPDKAMTVAAIDRLVHHATILEFDAPSFRRLSANERAKRAAR